MLPSLIAILRALAAVVRRDLAGYGLIKTNNFFLFIVLLVWGAAVAGVEPVSSYPFLLLLAALLFFPISSDPLEKIPAVRLGLWPLTGGARVALRVASLAASPIAWMTVGFLVRAGRSAVVPVAVMVGVAVLSRWIPSVPRTGFFASKGRPGGLRYVVHVRGMGAVLDTWLALAICVAGTGYRISGRATDSAAWPIFSILVGIALSTWAQSGAGLDATRYRLLPLAAWRILLARDAVYLAVQFLFTVTLDPLAGLAFGLTALALGRYAALHARLPHKPWRFASGRVFWGVLQMVFGSMLAFAGGFAIMGAAALYAISLAWGTSTLAERYRGVDSSGAPRR